MTLGHRPRPRPGTPGNDPAQAGPPSSRCSPCQTRPPAIKGGGAKRDTRRQWFLIRALCRANFPTSLQDTKETPKSFPIAGTAGAEGRLHVEIDQGHGEPKPTTDCTYDRSRHQQHVCPLPRTSRIPAVDHSAGSPTRTLLDYG